jgi:alanine or glycine:cation symporter, AGCS family
MGRWMVTMAAWLFAISTMISWSYYGEQGMVFLFGNKSVFPYKIAYCFFIVIATIPALINTDTELDNITALGTGIMLWANIPIMLIFGKIAMDSWRNYMKKLRAGEFHPHEAPSITDVVEGKDIE